jgi:hypothetical protein
MKSMRITDRKGMSHAWGEEECILGFGGKSRRK